MRKGDVPMLKLTRPLIALNEMILWTLERQKSESVKNLKKSFSPLAFAKEFCTIKFCLPRQSGHTTCALCLAKQHFFNTLFVVYHHKSKDFPNQLIKEIDETKLSHSPIQDGIDRKIIVKDKNSILDGRCRGLDMDAIILDCASLYSSTLIESIYEEFTPYAEIKSSFIFLFLE